MINFFKNTRLVVLIALMFSGSLQAEHILVPVGDDFENRLQAHLASLKSGDILELPEGRFSLTKEVILIHQGVEFRGQGPDKTVLDFTGQKQGAQALLARANNVALDGFTIKNAKGDGIVARGSKRVSIKNVHVLWDKTVEKKVAGYGIYPVLSKQITIDYCRVDGAKEAGIYVGQSIDASILNNHVENNTSGIDVENSTKIRVENNTAINNSIGIIVSKRPNLLRKASSDIELMNNTLQHNNRDNNAPPHSLISVLGKGIGAIVVASQNIILRDNAFSDHTLSHVVVLDYVSTGRSADTDPLFSEANGLVEVLNNQFNRQGAFDKPVKTSGDWRSTVGADIVWDGIIKPSKNKTPSILCIEQATSLNFINRLSQPSAKEQNYSRQFNGRVCNPE